MSKPPPGWYPIPPERTEIREWDGAMWIGPSRPLETASDTPLPITNSLPAGWLPNPSDPGQEIFWDGASWTGVVRSRPDQKTASTGVELVTLTPSQRRVEVAHFASNPMAAEKPITVPADSLEALRADQPFNPTHIPADGDLVPADCIWAFIAPPARVPNNALSGTLKQRLVALGTLTGRTYVEIAQCVGPPMATARKPDGMRTVVWGTTSIWKGIYQICLLFDAYDVCAQVVSETKV